MTKFADSTGRQWEPEVNVVTIGRVRSALKINLLELVVPKSTLPEKLTDPCLLVDVLYLLCRDAADAAGVDDVAFGKAMTPDGIEQGLDALLEGIVSFSPRGLRPAYKRVMEKAKKVEKAEEARLAAAMESPAFDKMLDEAIDKALHPATTQQNATTGAVLNSLELSESNQEETH